MRILIDECLDWRLKWHFPGHTAQTVTDMGWGGIKNGALLALAQTQFDVFITGDKNLTNQQNLANLSLAIIVLDAPTNRLVDSLVLLPAVLVEIANLQPGFPCRGEVVSFESRRSFEGQTTPKMAI